MDGLRSSISSSSQTFLSTDYADIDSIWAAFKTTVTSAVDQHVPTKMTSTHHFCLGPACTNKDDQYPSYSSLGQHKLAKVDEKEAACSPASEAHQTSSGLGSLQEASRRGSEVHKKTQSGLATLLSYLIARRWVGLQTL